MDAEDEAILALCKPDLRRAIEEFLKEHPKLRVIDLVHAGVLQFMPSGKDGRKAYYRRRPRTYDDPRARPPSQLKTHLVLSKAAYKSFGKRGFDGEGIPIVASEIKKEMKGKRYRKPKWKEIAKDLKESLRGVAEVVQEIRKKKKVKIVA